MTLSINDNKDSTNRSDLNESMTNNSFANNLELSTNLSESNNNISNHNHCEIEDSEDEDDLDTSKLKLISDPADLTSLTLQIKQEDHTLGNMLRYLIMQNKNTDYCGYSIPHPSEELLNLRIQTISSNEDGEAVNGLEVFEKGLDDAIGLCNGLQDKFNQAINEYNNKNEMAQK